MSEPVDGVRDPSQLVAAGYDRMGDEYTAVALRSGGPRRLFTHMVVDRLPPHSSVLDLGCGAGRPTASALAQHFRVTGVDVSPAQVARARAAVPGATFLVADMSRIQFTPETFDGVVAFYSIIHVPRDRQQALLESMLCWLRPGGLMVVSLATRASDAWVEEFLGVRMYWSSFDAVENEQMVRNAGFQIESSQVITEDGEDMPESHLWVMGRRPADG